VTSVDAVIRAAIDFTLRRKFLVLAIGITVLVWGRLSFHRLSFDAYADITDTHVQVITQWPVYVRTGFGDIAISKIRQPPYALR